MVDTPPSFRSRRPSEGLRRRLLDAYHGYLQARGVTRLAQEEVAALLEPYLGRRPGQSTISDWLNKPGKEPTDVDVLWAFAQLCAVSPTWLALAVGARDADTAERDAGALTAVGAATTAAPPTPATVAVAPTRPRRKGR